MTGSADPAASPPPLLAYRDGELTFDGHRLADLVAAVGTPLFLVCERQLLGNYRALRDGLAAAGPATVRYCAKTNCEAGVLRLLAREGAGLLASHLAEVELALACGFAASDIAFQRPFASQGELEAVLDLGVLRVHVQMPGEVPRLRAAARRTQRAVAVCVRLALPRRAARSPVLGLQRRLGLDPSDAVTLVRELAGSRVAVRGVNLYVGTQRRSVREFDVAVAHALATVRRLRDETRCAIDELDLGGGLPSPTQRRLGLRDLWWRLRDRPAPPPAAASPEPFARRLALRCGELAARAGIALPRLVVEPGRGIVGNAALLVARVEAVRGRWVFLDASRNWLGESPLLFARRILPLREPTDRRTRRVHLSGTTLNTTDVLDLHRRLPPLAAGDLVAFLDAGAYSLSRASRYAGLTPAVHLLDAAGALRPIRRAETWHDLAGAMELDRSPPTFAAAERLARGR